MQVTIYKKKNEPFDLVVANGYMFVAFHDLATPIDERPRSFGPYFLNPGVESIRQIGTRKPGFNSAGATVIEMIPPAFLSFAGSYQPESDPAADLVLFDSYLEPGRQQYVGETALPGYAKSFVAFYNFGTQFMILTQSQASRILSIDFKFTNPFKG